MRRHVRLVLALGFCACLLSMLAACGGGGGGGGGGGTGSSDWDTMVWDQDDWG